MYLNPMFTIGQATRVCGGGELLVRPVSKTSGLVHVRIYAFESVQMHPAGGAAPLFEGFFVKEAYLGNTLNAVRAFTNANFAGAFLLDHILSFLNGRILQNEHLKLELSKFTFNAIASAYNKQSGLIEFVVAR